ncbi:hypothetical protein DLM75_12530 [Leptospira stimsonii]|uniref:Uncharacterized protein n=1 Tax=Leptospira stimsonii TaxID=2202203 RepID=A0A396Z9H6_9LEPT|nr:hypothetical protein DLM75_12530 [Leptospira stimsonii]
MNSSWIAVERQRGVPTVLFQQSILNREFFLERRRAPAGSSHIQSVLGQAILRIRGFRNDSFRNDSGVGKPSPFGSVTKCRNSSIPKKKERKFSNFEKKIDGKNFSKKSFLTGQVDDEIQFFGNGDHVLHSIFIHENSGWSDFV